MVHAGIIGMRAKAKESSNRWAGRGPAQCRPLPFFLPPPPLRAGAAAAAAVGLLVEGLPVLLEASAAAALAGAAAALAGAAAGAASPSSGFWNTSMCMGVKMPWMPPSMMDTVEFQEVVGCMGGGVGWGGVR